MSTSAAPRPPRLRNRPPFRADHVGSFLRPKVLLDAREKFKSEAIDPAALRRVEDEAIRDIVKFQEDLGLRGITDGEFRRTYFHIDFLTQLEGVETKGGIAVSFHSDAGNVDFAPPVMQVTSKVRHVKDDPARRLRVPEVGDDAHAEGHDPVADDAALPRRAQRDQPRCVSGPRGVLRRRRDRVPRRAAIARRAPAAPTCSSTTPTSRTCATRRCAKARAAAATIRTSCRVATPR